MIGAVDKSGAGRTARQLNISRRPRCPAVKNERNIAAITVSSRHSHKLRADAIARGVKCSRLQDAACITGKRETWPVRSKPGGNRSRRNGLRESIILPLTGYGTAELEGNIGNGLVGAVVIVLINGQRYGNAAAIAR